MQKRGLFILPRAARCRAAVGRRFCGRRARHSTREKITPVHAGRRRALSYALPDLQRLRCLRIRKNCSADPYTKLSRADKSHAPAQHTQALPGAIARRRPCKSVKMLAISRQMLYTQEYLDRGVVGTLRVILPTYWLAAWLYFKKRDLSAREYQCG